MIKHDTIPLETGLFWYFENGKDSPEPVYLDAIKHPKAMKGFNGRRQDWLRSGEYLLGPQTPPSAA
ncbi:hypothetical protein F0267_01520 [Vibrio coralliilyticus]|uniref:Uncharacterized protein n=2 Tax=Vibrio TaxID=662 RepID=A0AAN0SJT6_9VIBR|nr:hypothetical protein [Vibrio coralliilyticus]AIW22348.1 hypothetical protein IX92_25085 [Vibrio coralliilyticus]NOH36902.1 hypothetical protein [Vibrio coralliilyticus]CAH1588656.1 conserved hypothetical protein [Vibrio jasicida]CAH1599789.1 conserved hypothetical protein [Vibrio jasicida]